MRIKVALFWLIAIGFAAPALAGPFGLEMGMQLDQLSEYDLSEQGDYLYTTTRLPKNHSSFLLYGLVIHPSTGLCSIRAASDTITSSVYGTELRSKFEQITSQLSKAYGKPDVNDFLRSGSIWDDAKDFMTGLSKGERILQASWGSVDGPEIKDGVYEILLTAGADRRNDGKLTLQYRFANHKLCDKLKNEEEADAF